jgi:hypothetical protein
MVFPAYIDREALKESHEMVASVCRLLCGILFLTLRWADTRLDDFTLRILRTGAVYIVAAVSYNLINGITGQFSLGPNGFMALGGYTVALLMLPLPQKKFVWFLKPLIWPFNSFSFPSTGLFFSLALILGGLMGALGAFIVGIPSFRLRGDYLAIATFGFGEIIFVLANNLIPLTNGPLGMKGIPELASIYWCFGWAVIATLIVKNIANSSYGRAMKAVQKLKTTALESVEVVTREIPTVFGKSAKAVEDAILEVSPQAVISVGQAGGTPGIRVERVALNLDDARIPDNEGSSPGDSLIDPAGPVAYWATIPVREVVDAIGNRVFPRSFHTAQAPSSVTTYSTQPAIL